MSAPIAIPIGIEDTGSQALMDLMTNFDNVAQAADKVGTSFTEQEQHAQSLQSQLQALAQMHEQLTTAVQSSTSAYAGFNSNLSAGLGSISDQTAAVNELAAAHERLAAAAGSSGGMAGGGGAPIFTSSGSAADDAQVNAARASAEAQYLNYDLNDYLSGGSGGTLGYDNPAVVADPNHPSKQPAEKSERGGYGGGGYVEQLLLYGGGYAAYSGLKNAIGGASDQSSALAGETASLGLNYQQGQALNTSSMDYAGSGQSIYGAAALNQGAYVPYTYNAGGTAQGNLAMTQTGAKLAQALGATDPTDAENALALLGNAYGGGQKGAQSSADILTQVTLSSGFDLPQIAANVGQFASVGAERGISKSDLLSSYGQMSAVYGPERAGQGAADMQVLMRELGGNANAVQRHLGSDIGVNLGDANLVQDSGGWENLLKEINTRTSSQGPAAQQQYVTAMFGPQGGMALNAMMNHGDFSGMDAARAAGTGGTAMENAYQTTQQFSGTQMKEAETEFGTAVDKLATEALPTLVSALKGAADVINGVVAGIDGQKTPGNPSGATALDTLGLLMSGTGLGTANDLAARGQRAGWDQVLGLGGIISGAQAFGGWAAHHGDIWASGTVLDSEHHGGSTSSHPSSGPESHLGIVDTTSATADAAARQKYAVDSALAAYNYRVTQDQAQVDATHYGYGAFNETDNATKTATSAPTQAASATSEGGGGYDYSPGRHLLAHQVGQAQQQEAGIDAGFARGLSSIGTRGAATQDLKSAKDKVLNLISSDASPGEIASAEAEAIQVIMAQPGDASINAHNAQVFDDAVQKAMQAKTTKDVHDAVTEINAKITDLQAGATLAGLEGNTALATSDNQQINALRTQNAHTLGLSANTLALQNYQQLQGGASGGTDPISRARQDLTNALTLAQGRHDVGAENLANQNLYAFDVAHAAHFGYDASDLAVEKQQMTQSMQGPATPGYQLIRPQETGYGDALAGFGNTVNRLSTNAPGHDPQAETIRHLQEQIALLERELQEQQKTNDHLVDIKDELATNPATPPAERNAGKKPRRIHTL